MNHISFNILFIVYTDNNGYIMTICYRIRELKNNRLTITKYIIKNLNRILNIVTEQYIIPCMLSI